MKTHFPSLLVLLLAAGCTAEPAPEPTDREPATPAPAKAAPAGPAAAPESPAPAPAGKADPAALPRVNYYVISDT